MFKKICISILTLFVSSILLSAHVAAKTSVFTVSKQGQSICIGGTVHLLSPDQYPLPSAYDACYAKADTLVLETFLTPEAENMLAQSLAADQLFKDGQSLQSQLSAKTWQRLKQYSKKKKLPIPAHFKAQMVTLILTISAMQEYGLTAEGVDKHFQNRALKDKKVIVGLETPETQLNFLKNLGKGQEDALINYTLDDLDNMQSILKIMLDSWRTGDLSTTEVHALDRMKAFPSIYDALLVQRNKNWLPQIEAMLASPEKEFVLVGDLHLAGDDGLLALLKVKGYSIKQHN